MEWSEQILLWFLLLSVPLIVVVLPIYLLSGGLRTFALRPLERCYEGIDRHETPQTGDVQFVYHTYRGLLLWITQDEHRVSAPIHDAERLLGRLLKFNLTWGMLSYGMLFIPLLATMNYYSQRKSIREEDSRGGYSRSPSEITSESDR